MLTLKCDDCGEEKMVTDRTVVSPFVCDECRDAINDFQNAIAPAELDLASDLAIELESGLEAELTAERNKLMELKSEITELNEVATQKKALEEKVAALSVEVSTLSAQIMEQDGQIESLSAGLGKTTSLAKEMATRLIQLAAYGK